MGEPETVTDVVTESPAAEPMQTQEQAQAQEPTLSADAGFDLPRVINKVDELRASIQTLRNHLDAMDDKLDMLMLALPDLPDENGNDEDEDEEEDDEDEEEQEGQEPVAATAPEPAAAATEPEASTIATVQE